MNSQWILCPYCQGKTRVKVLEHTVLENSPLFCPRCKRKTSIQVKQLHTAIVNEPDAKTQSR